MACFGLRGQIDDVDKALVRYCGSGQAEIAAIIIRMGAQDLETAMLAACGNGHLSVVDMLIARLMERELNSRFPLSFGWDEFLVIACECGHDAIAERLLAAGATKVDRALYGACYFGQVSCAELMIKHGAHHFNECHAGACEGNAPATMRLMQSYGATKCGCDRPMCEH